MWANVVGLGPWKQLSCLPLPSRWEILRPASLTVTFVLSAQPPTLSLTGGLSLTAKSFALHSSSHGQAQPSCIQVSSITAQAKERGNDRMQRKELWGGGRERRKTSSDQINATVSTSDKSCLGSSLIRA